MQGATAAHWTNVHQNKNVFLIKLCTSTYFCLTAFWSLLKASKQAVDITEHIRVCTVDNDSDKRLLFVLPHIKMGMK